MFRPHSQAYILRSLFHRMQTSRVDSLQEIEREVGVGALSQHRESFVAKFQILFKKLNVWIMSESC